MTVVVGELHWGIGRAGWMDIAHDNPWNRVQWGPRKVKAIERQQSDCPRCSPVHVHLVSPILFSVEYW